MAKGRKMINRKCDCGGYYKKKQLKLKGVVSEASVCGKCGNTNYTLKQAKKWLELKKIYDMTKKPKKIIKIGNSFGITLPEGLKEFGLKVGKKLKLTPISKKEFKIKFL